jgi:hypothetical protein
LQIVYGLPCAADGCPVAIGVHCINRRQRALLPAKRKYEGLPPTKAGPDMGPAACGALRSPSAALANAENDFCQFNE